MIEKFLNPELIKSPLVDCDTICAFTGEHINKGVEKKKVLSLKFTDYDLLKYESNYISEGIVLLLSNVIDNGKGRCNPLRNYSFICSDNGYSLLKREDLLYTLLNIEYDKFQICVTFSNKKHIAYRAKPQYNKRKFVVTTDIGNIEFDVDKTFRILPVIQSWYTIIKGNKSAQEPTYFTKSDIIGETEPNFKKIKVYGIDKYKQENEILNLYRGSMYFKLLIHILNKTR